ncbi:LuxR family transcriptional regulator [Sandarakinorhabdus sp.]|uniref:helix-turn-helix transcriptional regulator n=1 Tax=Sandarakinorhabdus sp. TaxID=1916663 RepID=UPI00286E4037|nr:LuxR family transcriptional regulator [Sandarakinorhabdus sp.]
MCEADLTQFCDIQEFVVGIRSAPLLTDVGVIMKEATRRFRFDHFALAQKTHRSAGSSKAGVGPLRLTDFPEAWVEKLANSNFLADDPVLMACERSVAPFAWDQIDSFMPMSGRQSSYMATARQAGLGHGYTVPIHVPGEASGLCSFVMQQGNDLPEESLPAAQYLACFAFEAARRLQVGETQGRTTTKLTQRQLDVLVLAARGKSNWVSGQLLGLSEGTVHKYIEAAKRRYGVSTRTELVVRALYDGQLSFGDIIG